MTKPINHINTYGSLHTDSIVTENYTNAMRFLREVDSSSVNGERLHALRGRV